MHRRLRLVQVAALLGLVGCSAAPAAQWMLYSRGAYLYGRAEAFGQMVCQAPVPDHFKLPCEEAAKIQAEVKNLNPVLQAELIKSEPDWGKIMQYLDLVMGFATKFLALP